MDFLYRVYEEFENVAGRAALFELKVRLLADKTKTISELSDGFDFDRVYRAVVNEFSSRINESEREQLKLAKKLRDHIVHGEFQKAFWKLKPASGGVRAISGLEGISNDQLLAKITGLANGTEEATPVPFTKGVGKFGWLLECAAWSLFNDAFEASTKAIAIIDRISLETAKESVDPR